MSINVRYICYWFRNGIGLCWIILTWKRRSKSHPFVHAYPVTSFSTEQKNGVECYCHRIGSIFQCPQSLCGSYFRKALMWKTWFTRMNRQRKENQCMIEKTSNGSTRHQSQPGCITIRLYYLYWNSSIVLFYSWNCQVYSSHCDFHLPEHAVDWLVPSPVLNLDLLMFSSTDHNFLSMDQVVCAFRHWYADGSPSLNI